MYAEYDDGDGGGGVGDDENISTALVGTILE